MVRTQISLTEEQAEGLRRLAALRQRSQAALLRDAIDQLLESARREDRYAAALSAIGAFRSDGGGSIAVDHDEALEEAYGS
jgi:Arc/MetJ-type ribon-helix-helix transcriptional regulator